jgi:hypothetical protein
MRAKKFFVNHVTPTAIALHRNLLFSSTPFEHRGKEIVMAFFIFEDFFEHERRSHIPLLLSLLIMTGHLPSLPIICSCEDHLLKEWV